MNVTNGLQQDTTLLDILRQKGNVQSSDQTTVQQNQSPAELIQQDNYSKEDRLSVDNSESPVNKHSRQLVDMIA